MTNKLSICIMEQGATGWEESARKMQYRGCKESSSQVAVESLDVLCTRRNETFSHVGNTVFLSVINEAVPAYIASKTLCDRARVARAVIEKIANSGARFLRKHQVNGCWMVMAKENVQDKVGNELRYAAKKELMRQAKVAHTKANSVSCASVPEANVNNTLISTGSNPHWNNTDAIADWSGIELDFSPSSSSSSFHSKGCTRTSPSHYIPMSQTDMERQPSSFAIANNGNQIFASAQQQRSNTDESKGKFQVFEEMNTSSEFWNDSIDAIFDDTFRSNENISIWSDPNKATADTALLNDSLFKINYAVSSQQRMGEISDVMSSLPDVTIRSDSSTIDFDNSTNETRNEISNDTFLQVIEETLGPLSYEELSLYGKMIE